MKKDQRVRDFVHDLIVFRADNETDVMAWKLINTREFQRLRRIKQLGFSEFVFPGATHTRFSHSIGVYHTARLLLERVRKIVGSEKPDRERVCLLAALLHDIGHGPFSHAFEDVQINLKIRKKHENWSGKIIEGDTEINQVLEETGVQFLARDIASLVAAKEPKDIYASIVSSQFDADRLDYLRRDRYMTGTGLGGFDFVWLLDCLRVENIVIGEKESDLEEVPGLCLSQKGIKAAEGYLLARFHLYTQVYLHKTTRGAEKMLSALILAANEYIKKKDYKSCPILENHPLSKFLTSETPTESDYFYLDDFSIWSAIQNMTEASDEFISGTAVRLINRKFYKCFDVGELSKITGGDSLVRFRKKLKEFKDAQGNKSGIKILTDVAQPSAYSPHDFDERGALQMVLIQGKTGVPKDIAECSEVVKAIGKEKIHREYAPDEIGLAKLKKIWEEVSK